MGNGTREGQTPIIQTHQPDPSVNNTHQLQKRTSVDLPSTIEIKKQFLYLAMYAHIITGDHKQIDKQYGAH